MLRCYVWYVTSDIICLIWLCLIVWCYPLFLLSQISLQLFHYKNENLLFNKDPENFKNSCEKLWKFKFLYTRHHTLILSVRQSHDHYNMSTPDYANMSIPNYSHILWRYTYVNNATFYPTPAQMLVQYFTNHQTPQHSVISTLILERTPPLCTGSNSPSDKDW